MRQFLRKRALVAVLSGIALVCMSQPASAAESNPTFRAQVTPNGVGDLLIFAYWTAYERDTLIAITNAFGDQNERYVHLQFHRGTDGARIESFTICLSGGDVWTAAISSNGRKAANATLTVGNPGSCDDTVTGGLTLPPMSGAAGASTMPAGFGYIQAYTMECLTVGVTGCKSASPHSGDNDGGDDTITGTATLVSASAGFSSSYNATSLIGFDALNERADIHSANNRGRAHEFFVMQRCVDAACPTLTGEDDDEEVELEIPRVPKITDISSGSARTDVANALASEGGVDKEILMGRYTASPDFNSTTDLILTFPTGDQPQYTLKEAPLTVIPDPVSVVIFDEEENFTLRTTILDRGVNICTFQNSRDAASGTTEFSCNGATPAQIFGGVNGFTGGWFRILNNNDALNRGIGDGTAVEFNVIGSIPDSNFPVIGLLFSFFQGGNGIFDQAYGIQWAAITGRGGIGDPMFCSDSDGPDYMGCDGFNIASQYQPYSLPGGAMQTFSNLMGRNRRSDSGAVSDAKDATTGKYIPLMNND